MNEQSQLQPLWKRISECPLRSSGRQWFLYLQYPSIFPGGAILAVRESSRTGTNKVCIGMVIADKDRTRYRNLRGWRGTWVLSSGNSYGHRVWESNTENFLCKITRLRMYIWMGLGRTRRIRHTLKKCEIEEDTQQRNREHLKSGIMATSKVRAAITIANISPRDMPLLSCSWFSELSRLSNWDNMARIVNSLVKDVIACHSDGANL